MRLPVFKTWIFVLEWLNAFATALYFNYLFFFLKTHFGFTGMGNLLVCALNGFIYMAAAYYGGAFGQRHGYLRGLLLGFGVMTLCLVAGAWTRDLWFQVVLMVVWTLGMCFTWPTLEALSCEKESPRDLPRMVGIYNVVWASGTAVAYFAGGAIVEHDWSRMFWVPAVLHLVQIVITLSLAPAWQRLSRLPSIPPAAQALPHARHPQAAQFLKLAWLANPFAYIAINAAIPLIPELALRLQLSPKFAGFFCSIWFFARLGTFAILWFWPGWHYRFGWLLSSYLGVIASFAAMLLLDHLAAIVAVQVLFGWCVGLIYYSSLYYSMDAGEEKGAHGGLHEAALGVGIFGGPAIGALSLHMFPAYKNSSVIGVAFVLSIGLLALLLLRARYQR